ncbi:osmoprotectant transport system permease protein [Solibacillus kalamii]|uniref:Amino acid ABC transporter permease n=1 Tax=Solibacillus kalamii TaxID=1748298 RepID=A0ABX3ZGH4_9BACL|nr:ABC transporter permease [Solibacillus kalamii]MBM7665756.1 osmoprotectant transport system permease protein [Solibacillus kalamii]OUZ38796.1 amino acid ABC transporter permease [Solibacillus kalamii]
MTDMTQLSVVEQFFFYMRENGSYVFSQFLAHFQLSVYGVLLASIIGIPIGIWISKFPKLSGPVITLANIIQTIPALALMAIIMLVLGLGKTTVIVTVFFYSLLPIVKNTFVGIRNIDRSLTDAGRGMGMTKLQILYMVELPLSLSVIITGIRIALVVAIGIVAIGAFIGAGGLGDIIIRGTNATSGTAIILAGALPTALMAILADVLLLWLEKRLDPTKRKKLNVAA